MRVRSIAMLLLACVSLAVAGCSDGDDDEGEIRSDGGSAEMSLPDGALPSGVARGDIVFRHLAPADAFDVGAAPGPNGEAPVATEHVLAAYELGPDGTQLSSPARIRLTLPRSDVEAAGGFSIVHLSGQGDGLEFLEATIDDEESNEDSIVVEVEVTHFSVIAALQPFFRASVTPAQSTHQVGDSFAIEIAVTREMPFQLLVHQNRRHAVEMEGDRWGPPSVSLSTFFAGSVVQPESFPPVMVGGGITGPGTASESFTFTCVGPGTSTLMFTTAVNFVADVLREVPGETSLINFTLPATQTLMSAATVTCTAGAAEVTPTPGTQPTSTPTGGTPATPSPTAAATATPTTTPQVSGTNMRTGVDHPPFERQYSGMGASFALACGTLAGAPPGSDVIIIYSGGGTPGGTANGAVESGGGFLVPIPIFNYGPFSWSVQQVALPGGEVVPVSGQTSSEIEVGPGEPGC